MPLLNLRMPILSIGMMRTRTFELEKALWHGNANPEHQTTHIYIYI